MKLVCRMLKASHNPYYTKGFCITKSVSQSLHRQQQHPRVYLPSLTKTTRNTPHYLIAKKKLLDTPGNEERRTVLNLLYSFFLRQTDLSVSVRPTPDRLRRRRPAAVMTVVKRSAPRATPLVAFGI